MFLLIVWDYTIYCGPLNFTLLYCILYISHVQIRNDNVCVCIPNHTHSQLSIPILLSARNSVNLTWLDILLFSLTLYHKYTHSYLSNAMGISYEDSTRWSFSKHSTDEKLSMSVLEAYISISLIFTNCSQDVCLHTQTYCKCPCSAVYHVSLTSFGLCVLDWLS